MSLSLLKNYDSSDESDDGDENGDEGKPRLFENSEEPKEDEDSKSKVGKNFFMADGSDSEDSDQDGVEANEIQDGDLANFPMIGPSMPYGPSTMPYSSDVPTGPLYGPVHPSQMYNHAAYSGEASSSTGYDEYQEEPPTKRSRKPMTDEEAIKLIKRYEADSLGLAMPDDLEIIDVNVKSHMGDIKANLVKNITTIPTKEAAAAALAAQGGDGKKEKKPDGVAKRKHQITYLAYLAKANEEKLQNEWAKNRLTKRQTQAKYGF